MEDAGAEPRRGTHGSAEAAAPERDITVNMLVAYNMAFFRKAAGLTQEELGEELGGWTKVAVSAAERSWDGKRVRQFDADVIADIATVLGVPIAALFLPPEDDGSGQRYRLHSAHESGDHLTMEDWFAYVMSEPDGPASPAMAAYEERFVAAVKKYLDPQPEDEVAQRLRGRATDEQIAAELSTVASNRVRLEELGDTIESLLTDNDLLRRLLTTALWAESPSPALRRRRAWAALPVAHREWQLKLVEIGTELFGERGPADRAEIDRVIEEARQRGVEGSGVAAVVPRPDGTFELVLPEPGTSDDHDDVQ